jgi:integrase/recombinase XerC
MAPFLLLSEFETYLAVEKRYSRNTIVAYIKDLNQFIEHSCISTVDELNHINHASIRSWIVSLVEGSLENKTVNRKISTLRTFFKWLRKEQIIAKNPTARINGPKNSKRLPVFAKESELDAVKIDKVFKGDLEGIRDKLIFELFYQTGIRLSELIDLKNSDIGNASIKVLGKRNKERLIPISKELFDLIESYKRLKCNRLLKNDYLFILENGNKLYPKFVYRKIIYYLGLTTNLDKKSPHVLRHTFATHLLNNGAGLETIKDLLGHANLSATQVYTHNSFAKLSNIYSHAHPRGRNNN